jgi:hypothetical protein
VALEIHACGFIRSALICQRLGIGSRSSRTMVSCEPAPWLTVGELGPIALVTALPGEHSVRPAATDLEELCGAVSVSARHTAASRHDELNRPTVATRVPDVQVRDLLACWVQSESAARRRAVQRIRRTRGCDQSRRWVNGSVLPAQAALDRLVGCRRWPGITRRLRRCPRCFGNDAKPSLSVSNEASIRAVMEELIRGPGDRRGLTRTIWVRGLLAGPMIGEPRSSSFGEAGGR